MMDEMYAGLPGRGAQEAWYSSTIDVEYQKKWEKYYRWIV